MRNRREHVRTEPTDPATQSEKSSRRSARKKEEEGIIPSLDSPSPQPGQARPDQQSPQATNPKSLAVKVWLDLTTSQIMVSSTGEVSWSTYDCGSIYPSISRYLLACNKGHSRSTLFASLIRVSSSSSLHQFRIMCNDSTHKARDQQHSLQISVNQSLYLAVEFIKADRGLISIHIGIHMSTIASSSGKWMLPTDPQP